jgi:signal peptidase I
MSTKNQKKDKKAEEQPALSFKQKTIAFFKELGIVLGLFLVINNFVVASFLVPTGSMENEVMTGELLFVNKFIYGGTSPRNIQQFDVMARLVTLGTVGLPNVPLPWFRLPALRDVKRGDVIVFEFPGYRDELKPEEFQFYLKRCVAVSGDTVQIRNRVLYVNGQISPLPRNVKFDRSWPEFSTAADDRTFPPGSGWNEDNYGPLVVPKKGMEVSLNAQTYQTWKMFIRREGHSVNLIAGTVLVDNKPSASYTVERDYLFGMGDHRDNSLDGRYWGFIPKENIVGTPIIVYWSWNSDLPIYDIFGRLASVRWGRIGSVIR